MLTHTRTALKAPGCVLKVAAIRSFSRVSWGEAEVIGKVEKLFNGGNDTITPIDRVPDHVTYSLCTARRCDSRGLRAANGECEDKHKKNMRPRFWSLAPVSLYIFYILFRTSFWTVCHVLYMCGFFFWMFFFSKLLFFQYWKSAVFCCFFFFSKKKDSSS